MKHSILKRIKVTVSAVVCFCIIIGIFAPMTSVLTFAAAPTVDFSKYYNNPIDALADAYDSTMYKIESSDPEKAILNITTQEVYYVDGEEKYILSLSKSAVDIMGRGGKQSDESYHADYNNPDVGHYIAYNIKGGSELTMRSLRKKGFWQYADQGGYKWKFRFYVSSDYENWTPVEPEVETTNINYASADSWNPFTLEDNYTVKMPADAKFVKIGFPLVRNMYSVFTYTNGYEVLGTIASISYTLADVKAPAPAKKITFSNYIESTQGAMANVYDSTLYLTGKGTAKEESLSFSTTDVYYDDNGRKALLTPSKAAVEILEAGSAQADAAYFEDYNNPDFGYHFTYNVNGGTKFKMRALRKFGFWQYAEKKGYKWQFRFYVSEDNKNWSSITPEITTSDVNFTSADGWNPFTLEDNYSLTLPKSAKFIRIVFPQIRNLTNVFTHTNGYEVYGDIAEIIYTPAEKPAEKLEKYIEPKRDYKVTVDMTKPVDDTKEALADKLSEMYSYSIDAFVLGEGSANYIYKGTDTKNLFALRETAVKDKTNITSPYYIAYGVEPGTAFKLQSLHRERESAGMTLNDMSYRFKFYTSANGVDWNAVNPVYYNEEGYVTQKIGNNRWYSTLDTYVVDIPQNACIIKVVFPQTTDLSKTNMTVGQGEKIGGNYGDWQVASIMNISYTKPTIPPPRTVNFVAVTDLFRELTSMYDRSKEIKGSEAEVFSKEEAKYTENSVSNKLFSLSTAALQGLEADSKFTGYYITYNVEENSPFRLVSPRSDEQSKLLMDAGLEFKFKFFVSKDNKTWKEQNFDLSTVNSTDATYNKLDTYTFDVPGGYAFVKIVFPQLSDLNSVVGGKAVGNLAAGIIKELTYTPAIKAAKSDVNEPEAEYSEKLDFTRKDIDLLTVLFTSNTNAEDKLSLTSAVCTSPDGIYNPLSLTKEALSGKLSLAEPYSITYEIKQGTSIRLEGLRNYSMSGKVTTRGLDCRFKFFTSADGENWEQVTDYWFNSEYYNSNEYDVLDTYVVKTKSNAKYIKIAFPQEQDYRRGTSSSALPIISGNVGNTVIGVIRSISFSPVKAIEPECNDVMAELKSFMKASSKMYDYSANVFTDEVKAEDAGVFDVGEAWFTASDSGKTDSLMSLTFESLYYLSKSEPLTDGYYITYNVEPDTLFQFNGYHHKSAENVMKNAGLSHLFKIFVSSDNKDWNELSAEDYTLRSVSPSSAGNYDVFDYYSFVVPKGMNFVKIEFPQLINLMTDSGFGGSPGNYQCGTINAIKYTPAKNPAKPLREEPKHKYNTSTDMSTNYNKYLYLATNNMYSFTPGVLSMGETWYTVESENDIGGIGKMDYPLLCLTFASLYEKETLENPYQITYNVEPGTAFRLESLRNYSTANRIAKAGRPVLFKIYESSDNKNWTLCDTEVYTSYFNSVQFDAKDVYIATAKNTTNFIKIVFPQQQDNGDVYGKGSPGNWQFATVRKVEFTTATNPAKRPAIKSDYNPNIKYGAEDLSLKYLSYELDSHISGDMITPQTGDKTNLPLLILLAVGSLVVLVISYWMNKKYVVAKK